MAQLGNANRLWLPDGPGTLPVDTSALVAPGGLALAGGTLYVADNAAVWAVEDVGSSMEGGTLARVAVLPPRFGRERVTMAAALDGAALYVADGPGLLAVDPSSGVVTPLVATGLGSAVDVAVVGDRLYVANARSNRVAEVDPNTGDLSWPSFNFPAWREPPPFGDITCLAASPPGSTPRLFVGGSHGVKSVALPGGPVSELLPSQLSSSPTALAANAGFLYIVLDRRGVLAAPLDGNGSGAFEPTVANVRISDSEERKELALQRPMALALQASTAVNQTIFLLELQGALRTLPTWAMYRGTGLQPTSAYLNWEYW